MPIVVCIVYSLLRRKVLRLSQSHRKFVSVVKGIMMLVLLFAGLWGGVGGGGSALATNNQVANGLLMGGTPILAPARNTANKLNQNRPVLAFYYTWYTPQTWCL